MKNPVIAIVQARMGSSRLPNKMMLNLKGIPVVEWVRRRVSMAKQIDNLVFAIPDTQSDQELAEYLFRIGTKVYRGSETDVLERMTEAARTERVQKP